MTTPVAVWLPTLRERDVVLDGLTLDDRQHAVGLRDDEIGSRIEHVDVVV